MPPGAATIPLQPGCGVLREVAKVTVSELAAFGRPVVPRYR